MNERFYDEDYYIKGLESGKSAYRNYRWIPELTIPMVNTIINYLGINPKESVLDYGCARGYCVKALRILNRKSYGFDISQYAINNCDPGVKDFCSYNDSVLDTEYNYIIIKDVLEHLTIEQIEDLLSKLHFKKKVFIVLPLGNENGYIAPANNLDKSHIICESNEWWSALFRKNNLKIIRFTHTIKGIKDIYYSKYPKAHGFWTLIK